MSTRKMLYSLNRRDLRWIKRHKIVLIGDWSFFKDIVMKHIDHHIYITVELRMSLTHFLLALCILPSVCCASTIFYAACEKLFWRTSTFVSFSSYLLLHWLCFGFHHVFRTKRQLSNELKHGLDSIDEIFSFFSVPLMHSFVDDFAYVIILHGKIFASPPGYFKQCTPNLKEFCLACWEIFWKMQFFYLP